MGSPSEQSSAAADADGFWYDAFISYRHVEPDRGWAKWLHRSLETYRVPKKLARERRLPPRLRRVFRDEEELPASSELKDEIDRALRESRFLIVVCSPRTPKSLWVNREVERFRELGRHDRILALLVEGDPRESFPRALREIRRTVTDAQGMTREQVEEVEPLAADVRPARTEGRGHLGRMARLRLMACLLGVRFDDLRQREQERRTRRLAWIGAALGLMLLVMTGLAVVAVTQRNEAEWQRAEADRQRALAEQRERDANEQRALAELRLAEGLVPVGDALLATGRVAEGRQKYEQAWADFERLGVPTLPAELGLWEAEWRYASPAWTLPGRFTGRDLAFTPDGRAAVCGDDTTLRVIDLAAGREVRRIEAQGLLAFAPGGRLALCGDQDDDECVLRVIDLGAGREVRRVNVGPEWVLSAALSADGRLVLTAGDAKPTRLGRDPRLKLWDLEAGRLVHHFPGHTQLITPALSPDGRRAASASGNLLRVWDVAGGAQTQAIALPSFPTGALAFSPDSRSILCGAGSLLQFDAETGQLLRVLPTAPSLDRTIAFLPGGHAVFCARGPALKLVDLGSLREVRSFAGHSLVRTVAVSPDGTAALSADTDGTVHLWDLSPAGAGEVRVMAGHTGAVSSVTASPDGRLALSAGWDKTVRLWDVATGRPLRTFIGHTEIVTSAAYAPDGRTVLSASADGTVRLWDVSSGEVVRTFVGHNAPVQNVAFTADGRRAVSRGWDGALLVWNLSGGAPPRTLGGPETARAFALLPDGRTALWEDARGHLQFTDLDTGNPIRRLTPDGEVAPNPASQPGATSQPNAPSAPNMWPAIAVSPNGSAALTTGEGGTLRLWDLRPGQDGGRVRTLAGHGTAATAVAFAPDGRWAASHGMDGSLKLWDLPTGKELRALPDLGTLQGVLAFSPDNRILLTGGTGNLVKAWDFSRPERRRALRRRLDEARQRLGSEVSTTDPHARNNARAALDAALGEWYALAGLPSRAVESFEASRTAGAVLSPSQLTDLARCYWALARPREAVATFREAMSGAKEEAERSYLSLCLAAAEGEITTDGEPDRAASGQNPATTPSPPPPVPRPQ